MRSLWLVAWTGFGVVACDWQPEVDSTLEGRIEALEADQSSSVPVGTILAFAGETAPPGYLLCDGRTDLPFEDYQELFDVIGSTYCPGAGQLRLPDARGRTLIGAGQGESSLWSLGDMDGEESVALSVQEMPSHSHGIDDPGHTPPSTPTP